MKAYKGFNKDMTCRGFQYEEGKEYETDKAVCCKSGFHACEYPLDVLSYYNPTTSVYHEVELDGDIDKNNENSKVSATKIKVGAKLDIAGIVKATIEYTKENTKTENDATGNKGASSATGDYGASSATGNKGASSATGNKGASSATGNKGASSATGDYGVSAATGYKGVSSATGDYGVSAATGYKGASAASNQTGIAIAWGYEGMASGCKGTTLVLADWRYTGEIDSNGNYLTLFDPDKWEFHGGKLYVVDGVNIKENTFYSMINGKLEEVQDDR